MFPYVGCPVFNTATPQPQWKLFSAHPNVKIEGTLHFVSTHDKQSDHSDGETLSLEVLSVSSSCPTPRIPGRRRKLSYQCRKLSNGLCNALRLTREQKALCEFPNSSALQCLLERCGRWNFDPFLLNRLSGGHPVWCLGWKLFEVYNFPKVFQLDWTSVFYCLRLIENGYSANRFHNRIHAADVGQALHCFLSEDAVVGALTPLQKLGSILAAFGHDLYHRGFNQKFLENSNHFLCSLYNNVSVLENFHWRCLVSILIESRLVEDFHPNQWHELLKILELLILATDMQRQQEYLNQFQVFLRCNDPSTIGNGSSSNIQLMQPVVDCGDVRGDEERLFILQILIKCADIGNPCRAWKLSQEWSYRASTEFFSQGDEERRLKMPLTSFCDRYSTSVPKIQSGFMEFIAQPLFSDWDQYIQSQLSGVMLRNLKTNCERWTELLHSEILAGAVSGRRLSNTTTTTTTGRSSLEEAAELEVQQPDILRRRRVSASALLTTPYRRPSTGTPIRNPRRVSLPVSMQSSTLWTVRTLEKRILESQSVEEVNAPDGPIALSRPRGVIIPSRLDDLPEIQGSTPSLTSPKQDSTSTTTPRHDLSARRHSEPIIPAPVDLIPKEGEKVTFTLPATNGGWRREGRMMPRRGSLPLSPRQLEILRLTESVVERARSLGSCTTGSERTKAIEAT